MRTLRLVYKDAITTINCDIIHYIDLFENDSGLYKIYFKTCQEGLPLTDEMILSESLRKTEVMSIYNTLCEYVFYGFLKYTDNYIVTLTKYGVQIHTVEGDTSKATLKQT